MPEYLLAKTDEEYAEARKLFSAYAAWLHIDLSFQHFEEELSGLRSMYALPFGGILLCREEGEYIACVAIRKIDPDNGELKRMYVKPEHRHLGIGTELLKKSVKLALQCGYKRIRLDTLDNLEPAIKLYTSFGFRETAAYYYNPIEGAVFFELEIVGEG